MGFGGMDITNKRRSRMDIYADIIEAVTEKSKKTNISYEAGLNLQRCDEYLQELEENSLVKKEDSSDWNITEKGKEFLDRYKNIRDLLPRS